MSAVALDDAAHAHGRGTLEESAGNDGVGSGDGVAFTGDGEDAIMDALNDLADTGFHTSLVTEVSDVLAAFSNDDTSLLGGDDGAERQLGLSVFLVRLRGGLPVRAKALLHLELIHGIDDIVSVGGKDFLRVGHLCGRKR